MTAPGPTHGALEELAKRLGILARKPDLIVYSGGKGWGIVRAYGQGRKIGWAAVRGERPAAR